MVELMVALSVFALVGAYLADTFVFAARAERAVNKKVLTARTLQYIQGRIRRDSKWARQVRIPTGGDQGPAIEFSDFEGNRRTYTWTESTLILKIPDIGNPNRQVEFRECKFRYVDFYLTEGGGEGCRVIFSPLPMDENLAIAGEKEVVWGVSMVGRTELDAVSITHRFPLFNEPAYPRAQGR
jgi:hypothetical protein